MKTLQIFLVVCFAAFVTCCDVPDGGKKINDVLGSCIQQFGKDNPCKMKCMYDGLKQLNNGSVDMDKVKTAAANYPDGAFKQMITEFVQCKKDNPITGAPTPDCMEYKPIMACVDAAVMKNCPELAA